VRKGRRRKTVFVKETKGLKEEVREGVYIMETEGKLSHSA
jgi:hypothetical protein